MEEKIVTNMDALRWMSEDEFADFFFKYGTDCYCTNKPECGEMLDADVEIPESECKKCLIAWLRKEINRG